MIKQPDGHGFIPDVIEVGTDYVFGSSVSLSTKKKFAGVELVADGNWEKFLFPLVYSHQAPAYETNACTIFTLLNGVELLFNRVHGEILDLSERDVAIGAGVDPARGATFKQGAEWFRKNWALFEKEWPMSAANSVQEFYTAPPNQLRTVAKERGKKYEFGYEFITNPTFEKIEEALKYGPVGFSTSYFQRPDGRYERPENWTDGHAVLVIRALREDGLKILRILDSYDNDKDIFLKDLVFHVPASAVRYALDEVKYNALWIEWAKTWIQWATLKVKELMEKPSNLFPPPAYEVPPSELPMNQSRIKEWALGHQHAEGGKPQDLNMRLHNPGALKFTSYTASLGAEKGPAGSDGGFFCKFPTYEKGFKALCQFITDAAENKLIPYKGNPTISKFVATFTNLKEGSVKHQNYLSVVLDYIHVGAHTKIKDLL